MRPQFGGIWDAVSRNLTGAVAVTYAATVLPHRQKMDLHAGVCRLVSGSTPPPSGSLHV